MGLRDAIDEGAVGIATDAVEDIPETPAEVDDALPDGRGVDAVLPNSAATNGDDVSLGSVVSDTPLERYLD